MTDVELETFLHATSPDLLRRARLLTPDPQLAEDITQETLTRIVVK